MEPEACATWGSAWTRVSSESDSEGTVAPLPLVLLEIALLPLITASEFLYACVNTVEKAALIVSVRM